MTRFRRAIASINGEKYYIRVGYGKKLDCFGKMSNFTNSGTYDNKEDALIAFNAFVED